MLDCEDSKIYEERNGVQYKIFANEKSAARIHSKNIQQILIFRPRPPSRCKDDEPSASAENAAQLGSSRSVTEIDAFSSNK